MLSAFKNAMKVTALRNRILFTLALLFICRLIALVPTPGVDAVKLNEYVSQGGGGLMGMLNLFSGGAFGRCAVGTLGIMPYISASIILQLMTAVVPSLERLAREGDTGRQKLQQYTRYLALGICAVQAYMFAILIENGLQIGLSGLVTMSSPLGFRLLTVLTFCTGTMMMIWLGEQITARGVGNGISLVIVINIVSRMPQAIGTTLNMFSQGQLSPWALVAMGLLIFFVTMGTVMLTQGVRKIAVHTARRSVGRRVYGGKTNFMPLRVNYSGVMPVIFASPLLMLPVAFLRLFEQSSPTAGKLAGMLAPGQPLYLVLFAAMIIFFSFFWVATQFNPMRIADGLKRNQAYVPGLHPGKATADFLDHTMTRLTFIGALGLTIVAVLPMALSRLLNVDWRVTQFVGGTSLLIMVGVSLDTLRAIESHLVTREYDGFLKKGRIRGRAKQPR